VVPAGGSAYILQYDRLSVQYVACYIHSTKAVERSQNPTTIPKYQPRSNTLTTVQSLITPIMFRLIERTVVHTFLYPSFLDPSPTLVLSDQFVFHPSGSTSAAIISLHTVINLLQFEPFVVVMSLEFSKAVDVVQQSTLLSRLAELDLPTPLQAAGIDFSAVTRTIPCSMETSRNAVSHPH